MQRFSSFRWCAKLFAALCCGLAVAAVNTSPPAPPLEPYVSGPDSQPQPNVPPSKLFDFTLTDSKIFPGTARTITVYIPAQYRGEKPACVYVGLDGLGFEAPTVFDNLIHKKEMPVTIGIFVAPGVEDSSNPPVNPRFNRSFEFDGLSGDLARFIVEEVFPAVQQHKTPDGLPISLSNDPNDRAAGGSSTAAIGSFTLAWERPDQFRRVFTAIGTFVGMRGGDRYPVLIRKTEPKPIRIFMQDGSNDGLPGRLDEVGDWWMTNQAVERALVFAGYDVQHVWGVGSHSIKHANAIFPDAMRWLWRDWPHPIVAGTSQNTFLKEILLPEQSWQAMPGNYRSAGPLAANSRGQIVFHDSVDQVARSFDADGSLQKLEGPERVTYNGIAFGPDRRAYREDFKKASIAALSATGKPSPITHGIQGVNLVVDHSGNIYVTDAGTGGGGFSGLWLIKPNGDKKLLDPELPHPSGLALSPDGHWLAVAESKSHWAYSYKVQADGTLQSRQRFYWFHVPDNADDSGVTELAMDKQGRLYAATRMGVQVLDRNGRVRAILPVPGGEATGLAFGGPDFTSLFVSAADGKIYRRQLATTGVQSWADPIELPRWSQY